MRKPPDRTKGNAPAAVTAEASDAHNQRSNQRNKQVNSIAHPHNVPSLVIGDFTIRQDEEGRYCLNDLHAASGGEEKHAPWRWLRLQQATDLIAELDRERTHQNLEQTHQIWAVKTVEGRNGGTFAVKELVYAYAMWIRASFSLVVIRAYDAMMGGGRQNIAANLSIDQWTRLFVQRRGLMKDLSRCEDAGVAMGQYGNLLHVSRFLGMATGRAEDLAPVLRQMDLLEGGAA